MIGPGANVRVYLACGITDIRKGIDGLAALVQSGLRQKPTSGAVLAFRGRRGDPIKLLTWVGQGFCLYYKVLEQGRFPWPSLADGTARPFALVLAACGVGAFLLFRLTRAPNQGEGRVAGLSQSQA